MGSDPTTVTCEGEARKPRAVRVWTVFVAFVAALALQIVVAAAAAVYVMVKFLRAQGRPPQTPELASALHAFVHSPVGLVSLGGATAVLLLGLSLLLGVLASRPGRERLRLGPSPFDARTLVVATLGFLTLSTTADALFTITGWQAKGTIGAINAALEHAPLGLAVIATIVFLLAGVSEELLFRGYMQTRLVERWGRWPGILIASALFGLMHMDLLHGIFAFAIGIYLGFLADRAGSVRPSMLAHATNNAAWTLTTWFTGARYSPTTAVVLLGVCVLSTAAALIALRHLLPARPREEAVR